MNRPALRDSIYTYLGTTSGDPAFTPARLNLLIQNALNELYADFPESTLVKVTTLTPDSTDGSRYTFSAQPAPILDFAKAEEVRMQSASGRQLREVPYGQRQAFGAGGYSILGDDTDAVLILSPGTTEGGPLHFVYSYWPAPWTTENTECPGIPSRFHDVVALEAAKQAYAIGNEQSWPNIYEALRFDRRAQLHTYLGNRSRDLTLRRFTEN